MNRDEHLTTIATEECVEIADAALRVAQRISKAQRFGMEQVQRDADDSPEQNPHGLTNRERVRVEYSQLVGVMRMIGIDIDEEQAAAKQAKVERYLLRSARCGTLSEAKG